MIAEIDDNRLSEKENFEEKIEKLENVISNIDTQMNILRQESEEKRIFIETLLSQSEEKDRKINDLEIQYEELMKRIQMAEEVMEEQNDKILAMNEQIEVLQANIEAKRADNQSLTRDNAEMKNTIQQQNQIIDELKEKNKEYEKKIKEIQDLMSEKDIKNMQEISNYQKTIRDLRSLLVRNGERLKQLEKESLEGKKTLDDLQTKLNETVNQNKKFIEEQKSLKRSMDSMNFEMPALLKLPMPKKQRLDNHVDVQDMDFDEPVIDNREDEELISLEDVSEYYHTKVNSSGNTRTPIKANIKTFSYILRVL